MCNVVPNSVQISSVEMLYKRLNIVLKPLDGGKLVRVYAGEGGGGETS